MKTYKIGRYFYKELSAKQFDYLPNQKENRTYVLIDCDGEPIKYFIIINKKGGKK